MTRRRVQRGAVLAVLVLLLAAAGCRGPQPAPDKPTAPPTSRVLVSDRFDRSVVDGWGSADVGGSWATAAPGSASVSPGAGVVALTKPGTGSTVSLVDPQPADARASLDVVAPDTVSLGGGLYVGLEIRSGGGNAYRCKLRFTTGIAFLSVVREDGTRAERPVTREHEVARKVRGGEVFRLTCQASGSDPVALSTSALRVGAKPAWQVEANDTTASRLVTGGPTAVWTYLSGSARSAQRIEYREVSVVSLAPGLGPPGPPTAAPTPPAPSAPGGAARSVGAWNGAGADVPGSGGSEVPAGALLVSPHGRSDAAQDGSAASPFASVGAAVDAATDGATIVLRGGVYHESVVLPRARRLTLQAYPHEAVWFDGSSPVDRWRRDGAVWVTEGWTTTFDASPTYTRGAPEDDRPGWRFVNRDHPMAAHPDQVWVDDEAQRQVGSRRQVGHGSFYVDTEAHELVIGTDPHDADVRASTLSTAVTVLGEGDVVRGLGVRRYANSVWQLGVVALNVPDVTLADVVVSDNATTGISVIAPDAHLERVTSTRNGLMGVHVNEADGFSADGLLVSRNNLEHFNRAPSAGGLKMTRTSDVSVRASEFVDNLGHGFWCDISCQGVALTASRFSANTGAGVVFEISRGLTLAGSLLARNGLDGLWLIDSDRVEAAGNALVDNGRNGFRLVQDDRWKDARDLPWTIAEVTTYGNVVRGSGRTALVSLVDQTGTLEPQRRVLQLGHDAYQRPAAGELAEWTTADGGPSTVADLATFQRRWGQGVGSMLVEPGSDLVAANGRPGPELAAVAAVVAREPSPTVRAALGTAPGARLLGPLAATPSR